MNMNGPDVYQLLPYGMKAPYHQRDDDDVEGEPQLQAMMGTLGYVIASVELYGRQLHHVHSQGERVHARTMGAIQELRSDPALPYWTRQLNALNRCKQILGDVDQLLHHAAERMWDIRGDLVGAQTAVTALDCALRVAPTSGSLQDTAEQVKTRYAMAVDTTCNDDGSSGGHPIEYEMDMTEEDDDEKAPKWTKEKFYNQPIAVSQNILGSTSKLSNLKLNNDAYSDEEGSNFGINKDNYNLINIMEEVGKEMHGRDQQLNLKACSLLAAYLRKSMKCSCQNYG